MRVVTGHEMLAIDGHCIEQGMPAAALIEAAGAAVARESAAMLGTVAGRRIHILCGGGNNGADGFVAARYLLNEGARVRVFLTVPAEQLQADAALFHRVLVAMGCQFTQIGPVNERVRFSLGMADLIVDALLGTGARGTPREPVASLIAAINETGRPVLAVDLPSGVESDTGRTPGTVIKAERTITFGLPKLGLLLYPGAIWAGHVTVAPLGFPTPHLQWQEGAWPKRHLLTGALVSTWGANRKPDAHKGTYGRVLVVAGSAGMAGAGALTTLASLRAGCGLATWAGPTSLWPVMAAKVTEATTLGLPEAETGVIGEAAAPVVNALSRECDVVALGPGLGRHGATAAFVSKVLAEIQGPVVIDADALFALAGTRKAMGNTAHPHWVITPHPGEAARLLNMKIKDVENDRVRAVTALAEAFGCTAVLKGVPTLVQGSQTPLFINSTGNPGMATGGTGDVLTGIIAGLLAQGFSPEKAAAAGVFLHGRAGDLAAAKGRAGMLAGDLLVSVQEAVAECWN